MVRPNARQGIGVNAGVFRFSDLPGLLAEYDFSVVSSITDAGGGAVSQVLDRSGNGHTLTQPTGAQRPITGTRTVNGLNVLDFDGLSHNLLAPAGLYGLSAGNNTTVIVFQADLAGNTTQRIVQGQDAGTGRYIAGITDTGAVGQNNAAGTGSVTEAWTKDAAVNTLCFTRNGSRVYVNINGGAGTVSGSLGTSLTMTSLVIGAQSATLNRFDGRLCQIAFYSRALSDPELNLVGSSMRLKWGSGWLSI